MVLTFIQSGVILIEMKKKSKPKHAPRGPEYQRVKSWSKKTDETDPRRLRKRWKSDRYEF
jgi:hypothetical protein